MNRLEAAQLLAVVSELDRRDVTEEAAAVWAVALPDVALGDALTAVREHFRRTSVPLMPSHVLAGAKAARQERETRQAVSTDLSERALRACPWSGCRCTHTACTKGWLDDEQELPGPGGRLYTTVARCPECVKARPGQ
jgi:hypothetical protein